MLLNNVSNRNTFTGHTSHFSFQMFSPVRLKRKSVWNTGGPHWSHFYGSQKETEPWMPEWNVPTQLHIMVADINVAQHLLPYYFVGGRSRNNGISD